MLNSIRTNVAYAWLRMKNKPTVPRRIERGVLWPIKTHSIDPETLHFGQQHIKTVDLFDDPYHTVPLGSSPHCQFLADDERTYRKYLSHSWEYYSHENTEQNRDDEIEYFKSLLSDIRKNGIKDPIRYITRDDGVRVIFDGNHRASIAHHLGISVPAVEMSLKEFILRNALLSNKSYETDRNGLPHQSVYQNGKELVAGQRRDIKSRLELVDDDDLEGKHVLDFKCGIGSSSFIAAERGAEVVGVELDPDTVTSAIRLNVAFAHPCRFTQADISEPIQLGRQFETGFCFSFDNVSDDNSQLAENIRRHIDNVLYFETHVRSEIPTEIRKLAESVEFRGETGPGSVRRLYRVEL